MIIERTDNEVIIRLPADVNVDDLQSMINYARYKELTSKINLSQAEIDQMADGVNADWWSKNRDKLIS